MAAPRDAVGGLLNYELPAPPPGRAGGVRIAPIVDPQAAGVGGARLRAVPPQVRSRGHVSLPAAGPRPPCPPRPPAAAQPPPAASRAQTDACGCRPRGRAQLWRRGRSSAPAPRTRRAGAGGSWSPWPLAAMGSRCRGRGARRGLASLRSA